MSIPLDVSWMHDRRYQPVFQFKKKQPTSSTEYQSTHRAILGLYTIFSLFFGGPGAPRTALPARRSSPSPARERAGHLSQ